VFVKSTHPTAHRLEGFVVLCRFAETSANPAVGINSAESGLSLLFFITAVLVARIGPLSAVQLPGARLSELVTGGNSIVSYASGHWICSGLSN